jgi:hypothetical protein
MTDTTETVIEAEIVPETGHHQYSPSRLQQLKECPGSARMQDGLPEVKTPEADEGTMLHERIVTRDLSGLTTEQESLVCKCLEFLESKKEAGMKEIMQEVRLTIRDGEKPLTFGTADVVLLFEDHAVVIDWKFGRTPVTDANRNLQLAAYALGVMQRFNIRSVEVIVFQPRIHSVTSYTFTKPEAILHNISRVIEAAKNTDYLVLHAGDCCRYCLAKSTCPAFRAQFSALDAAQQRDLSDPATLLEYWEKSKVVERFLKEIKEAVERYVEENGSLGGWKFKEKPGNREIKDTAGLIQRLSYLITPVEFSSALKVSVTGIIDIMVEKFLVLAKAEGIKLTKTDAKKRAETEIADLISRAKPTRSLVKE